MLTLVVSAFISVPLVSASPNRQKFQFVPPLRLWLLLYPLGSSSLLRGTVSQNALIIQKEIQTETFSLIIVFEILELFGNLKVLTRFSDPAEKVVSAT